MSITFHIQDDLRFSDRRSRGRLFGACIEKTREVCGRSLEEAARLSGMGGSEWAAIEAGYVPDPLQLHPMSERLVFATTRSRCWPISARVLGNSNLALPPPRTLSGHWRLVLKPVYAHLQRKEVRSIKKMEGTGVKRMNVNLEVSLHNSFKAATAAQGVDMSTVIVEFIQNYVAKHGSASKPKSPARLKRAGLYMRVLTIDQHPETQLLDLRQMASQRGFEIVHEYTDRISGTKAKRPGLDAMMADAQRGRFDVVLVWASDRVARSVKHFLDVLDELSRLNIEYVSFRENIDTGGPLGRAIVVIVGAVAEFERNLIVERVRAGMRRARLEGRHIGRNRLELDHAGIQHDRSQGQSLRQIARGHRISTATVQRVLREYAPTTQENAA